jgi:hypothetical protein
MAAKTDLAKQPDFPAMTPETLEKVLVGGDLAKLSSGERLAFYGKFCQVQGLDPVTAPFQYINLNGKLTLYAGRACAEQLRKRDAISIQLVSREMLSGNLYVVTARAVRSDGRYDEATGVVDVSGLNKEALANAMMKCETKAKRRVTLSVCGLGLPDESEVGSIRGAARVEVDMATGEIIETHAPELPENTSATNGSGDDAEKKKRNAARKEWCAKCGIDGDMYKSLRAKFEQNGKGVAELDVALAKASAAGVTGDGAGLHILRELGKTPDADEPATPDQDTAEPDVFADD